MPTRLCSNLVCHSVRLADWSTCNRAVFATEATPQPHRSHRDDTALRQRLCELAQERLRFGYVRLHVLLRREGWKVNRKRVYRLYQEEGLKLRVKKRKRITSSLRGRPEPTTNVDQLWVMDFVSDALSCGRRFRALTLVDAHSRECLALEVDTSLTSQRVVRVLEQLKEWHGLPKVIQVDNGSEFTSRIRDEWAYCNKVKLHFIEPGQPTQKGQIEMVRLNRLTANCAMSA